MAIAGAICVVLGVIYLMFDPGTCLLFPKCPFRQFFGIPCPGCGSQRAVHALLNGHLAEAFHYNAYLVAALPFVLLLVFAVLAREKFPRLYTTVCGNVTLWIFVAVTVLWWALRIVFHWYV